MVAFTWAYLVGDYLHRYINPIKIKKHGNKAKSIFKYGLTYIATVFYKRLSISFFCKTVVEKEL